MGYWGTLNPKPLLLASYWGTEEMEALLPNDLDDMDATGLLLRNLK